MQTREIVRTKKFRSVGVSRIWQHAMTIVFCMDCVTSQKLRKSLLNFFVNNSLLLQWKSNANLHYLVSSLKSLQPLILRHHHCETIPDDLNENIKAQLDKFCSFFTFPREQHKKRRKHSRDPSEGRTRWNVELWVWLVLAQHLLAKAWNVKIPLSKIVFVLSVKSSLSSVRDCEMSFF